jgi:signal transduction histidine kinase/ligand-binding sensor protein
MKTKLREIIDIPANTKLLTSFSDAVGIPTAIVDLEGGIIIGCRWQRICTDFHRMNKRATEKCTESDTTLANNLKEGQQYSLYRCRNGLVDAAAPIVVQGTHIGNAFVGQFLTNAPDEDFFRRQAGKYGFDEKTYLSALSEVPIIEEEKVSVILDFLATYAEMLADMVLKHEAQLASERKLRETSRELSSQKATAKIIETDRKRLLSILDGIDDVIYVADPETHELLHVNKAFKAYWGKEVVGKKCHKVLQDSDEPCPFCTNNVIFGDHLGRSYIWEFQNEVNKHWYRCSDKAIRWVDGRRVRFEIATDITKLKALEKGLEDKNDQLERSNKELEQFAYVASHDLQEPLRMVASYTELLEERYKGRLDEKADKYIGYAVEGAKRMQGLINDLLVLSRVNTRGKPFEAVNCNDLVEKVLHGLSSTINEKQARIRVDHPLPTVTGDEGQLFQLFQNLISNAVKFHGTENPVVKISARQDNSEWIFSFHDNGIGIDPQFFDRIFVIFQRLHERGAYQGTGIGLSIAKKIVERHGGRIRVESEPGTGSTFYFSLQADKHYKEAEK